MEYRHVTTKTIMNFIAERIDELRRRREKYRQSPTPQATERISELTHLRHTMQTQEQAEQRESPANTAVRRTARQEQLIAAYRDAVQVQDACNLSGVVFSFARHMQTLCDMGLDTDQKNQHPVSVLFSSKITSLTGSELGTNMERNYFTAMHVAKQFIAGIDGIEG